MPSSSSSPPSPPQRTSSSSSLIMKSIDDEMRQSQTQFQQAKTKADETIQKIQNTSRKCTQKIGEYLDQEEIDLLKREAKAVEQEVSLALEKVMSSVKRTQQASDSEIVNAEKELEELLKS